MAAKKGKKKSLSPPLSLFRDFDDTGNSPEPSPSYFTELPLSQKSSGSCPSTSGVHGVEAAGDGPRPAGVKLYFRLGLNTEAVMEGLQQALRHDCTVVHIDLGCALQVDWKILVEPLLRHLVQETLVSVQVPSLKVVLIKGKCIGALLDLLRQQVGNYVTVFHWKFKTHHFLNTNVITDKIKAPTDIPQENDKPDKIKDTIKVLKEVADSGWNNSPLLESHEFRVTIIRTYKVVRKKGKFQKKLKRKLDEFKEALDEDDGMEEPKVSKRRRHKHNRLLVDETISDESVDSDTDAEVLAHQDGPGTKMDNTSPSPDSDNSNCKTSLSPTPSP